MYPENDARLLKALVAKHSQYSVIKEILLCSDITEYIVLENGEIERLIQLLQDIYLENIKDEEI
jgi:hypothetical protein